MNHGTVWQSLAGGASPDGVTAEQASQIAQQATAAPVPVTVMTRDYAVLQDDQRIVHDSTEDHSLTPLDPAAALFRRFVFSNGYLGGRLRLVGTFISPTVDGTARVVNPVLPPGASVDVISRFVADSTGTSLAPPGLRVDGAVTPDGTTGSFAYDVVARNFGGPSAEDFGDLLMTFRNTQPSQKNPPVTKTAAYTAAPADSEVRCDTTGGAFTVTLPAGGTVGNQIIVKWIAGTTPPTVAFGTNAQGSDAAASAAFSSLGDANTYELATVVGTAPAVYTYDLV